MKKFILVLFLLLNLQSLTKADDIKDFEIDGRSVGKSLLEFYSLKDIKIEVETATYYPKSKKMMVVGFRSKDGDQYEKHEFHIKRHDEKYIIYSIKGIIELQVNDCLAKKKKIVNEIKNQISNAKREDYKGTYGDSFGSSFAHITDFDLKDGGSVRVWCSEWDQTNEKVKDYLYTDSLAVNLSSKEQINFVDNEAY